MADVLSFAGCMFNSMRRDGESALKNADELIQLTQDVSLTGWIGSASRFRGEALVLIGNYEEGIDQISNALALMEKDGVLIHSSITLGFLAEAQAKTGQPEEGLNTIKNALEIVQQRDERLWEAELYRIQGELLLRNEWEDEAESSFLKAIEVAREQQGKSWELRVSIDLAKLWNHQGKTEDALQILNQIYEWFTEGYETPDLKEAQSLLMSWK